MKTNNTLCVLLIFLSSWAFSCKKDFDKQLPGTYAGTVRYQLYRYPDSNTPIKDTLYTNVLISIDESEGSSRKEVRLNIRAGISPMNMAPTEGIPVSNGTVDYYTTERGTTTSNQWKGSFTTDSLKLTYRRDDHTVYITEYDFKAKKQ